jgi:PAS domain S-box-containing protein
MRGGARRLAALLIWAGAILLVFAADPPDRAAAQPGDSPAGSAPVAPAGAVQDTGPKRPVGAQGSRTILIVGSYESPALSSIQQVQAIEDAIGLSFPRASVHIHYVTRPDPLAIPDSSALRKTLAESLRARFGSFSPDVLVVVDTLAFRVVTEEAPELFEGVPMVFSGVVPDRIAPDALSSRSATGVFEVIDSAGTLDLMLRLQPDLKRVLVIAQGAPELRKVAQAQLAGYETQVKIDWARSASLKDLRTEVNALGPGEAAMLLSFYDPSVPRARDAIFREPWSVPIYSVFANNINQPSVSMTGPEYGAVGGRVISYPAMGHTAGALAVRVLRGEDPRSIPPTDQGGLITVVDYRQLKRLDIPTRRIPPGVTVYNRPAAFLGLSWPYLAGALAAIIIEGAIIVLLIRGRRRLRRVQDTLAKERERYKLAVSTATESVWDWDIVNDVTHWSGRVAEMMGLGGTRADAKATHTWSECLHPDDRTRVQQALDGHLKDDRPYAIEYRLRLPDGRYRWYASRGQCLRNASHRAVRMTGTLTDITERVATEKRLAQSEERFRAIFEKHAYPMWVYERESARIIAVNDAAIRKYGYSHEEFTKLSIYDLRSPAEAERLATFLATQPPDSENAGVWRHRIRSGQEIDVLVTTSPVPWLADRSTRLGTFIDVTEKLAAERLRDQQNHILEMIASEATIGEILHEIIRVVRHQDPEAIGSVLLLDPESQTAHTAAAPDLPREYSAAIDGARIGPNVGSCGTAMHRRERVIVSDIATDPLWKDYRQLALSHGLLACWSEPIMSSHGGVLGSFAMYYRLVRLPSEGELQLIASAARLAGIAIERRRLEQTLHTAELRFRALFQQSAVGIAQVGADCRFILANAKTCEILGRTPEQLIGHTFSEFTHPDDVQPNLDLLEACRDRGDGYELEKRYVRPDGRVVWAHVNVRILRKPDGQIDYLITAIQDITEARESQRRLAASEEQYRRLLTDVRVIAWEADPATWQFTFVAGQAEAILGYPVEEWLTRNFWPSILHAEDRERTIRYCREHTEAGADHEFEYRAVHRDGRIVWLRDMVSVETRFGRPIRLRGVMIDVTEEKLAEAELERFFQLSPVMLCTATPNGYFSHVNPAFCATLGYSEEKILAAPYLDLVHPDDRAATVVEAERINREQVPGKFENRYLRADGEYRWISWQSTHLDEMGVVYAAARDITEERAAAEALRKSESKYRHIVETAQEGVWLVDESWKTIFVNARMAGMLGIKPEDMLGRHIFEFCDEEAREQAARNMEEREGGKAAQHDFRLRHADGHDVWTLMSTNAIADDNGQFMGALAMVTDITQRRQADEALRESEATNRALLAALPDLLFRVDASGRYLYFKGPPDIPLLVPPEKFLGRTMREVLPPEIAETCMKALAAALSSGQVQLYEYQTMRGDKRGWWEGRVVPAAPGEALILVREITQRREAEEALRDSQKRLSQLVSQAPIGIIVWNTRFEIQQWNPAAQRIFGFTPQEVIGKHGEVIVPPEVRPSVGEIWRSLMAQRGGMYSINENTTRSGDRIICEWNNTPLVSADGAVMGVSSFVQDVTERVMSERRQALMMQELDHRVKNNMAAVLSLAEQTGRSTATFDEFQSIFMGRVRALARMHTVLAASRWRGADLAALVRQTVEPYSGPDSGRLDAEGPPVSLAPRAAQSLAMTLNELATNAAKYGALSGPAGRVTIRWSLEHPPGTDVPILRLEWRERGGPSVSPPRRRGLGIDLIEGAIIYQLTGKVEFRFQPEGLECSLLAPLANEDKPTGHPGTSPAR